VPGQQHDIATHVLHRSRSARVRRKAKGTLRAASAHVGGASHAAHATSPLRPVAYSIGEPYVHIVAVELPIDSDQNELFELRLRDQQPVERITMMSGQRCHL